MTELVEVAIIGAGQAGLAAGYYLTQQNRNFVILEQAAQVGQAWRDRWDSLKLITPTPYNDLPGLPFPHREDRFPCRNAVIAYLEEYARRFDLPIRYHQPVKVLKPIAGASGGFQIETPTTVLEAQQVIIATGAYHQPSIPAIAADLPSHIYQIHSSQYRNPAQVSTGAVLVVGNGNSGAQLAQELAASHKVYLSMGSSPSLPRQFWGQDLFWWLHALKLTHVSINSRFGKRLSQRPDTQVGVDLKTLATEGKVILLGRTTAADDKHLYFGSGETIPFSQLKTIIWATGFRPNYHWVQAPIFDADHQLCHQRGVTAVKGLYFLGLRWQHCLMSSLLGGVGEDAAYITTKIAEICAQDTIATHTDTKTAPSLSVA